MAAVLAPQHASSSPSPTSLSSPIPLSSPSPDPPPDPARKTNLPPLTTSPPVRSRLSDRRSSFALARLSSHSAAPKSRPLSTAYPIFHTSLSYALVRDFAYPDVHPMHYGPPPEPELPSGLTTPASESHRRLSDPLQSWDGSRGAWSAGPWGRDAGTSYDGPGQQLPSTSFDDGPPFPEDEDEEEEKDGDEDEDS
ncbi:HOG (high osmolarity glycerol) pathway protein, partial [Elasticomyces elasticus]